MSSLREALDTDTSGYAPVQREQRDRSPVYQRDRFEPEFNPMMRCPLPPVSVTPDSLRQFYSDNKVPQTRLLTSITDEQSPGNTTVNQTTTVIQNGGGGGGTSSGLVAKQAAVTTAVLNPGDQFIGSFIVAKSFQMLSISSNGACRVELYGTSAAQLIDLGRQLDIAPAFGAQQNLISDVVLDVAPYQWTYQNRMGANADSPQTSLVYVTVSNVGSDSMQFTVTMLYVPLES